MVYPPVRIRLAEIKWSSFSQLAIHAKKICNKLYFLFICGEVKGAVMELDEASVKRGTLVME